MCACVGGGVVLGLGLRYGDISPVWTFISITWSAWQWHKWNAQSLLITTLMFKIKNTSRFDWMFDSVVPWTFCQPGYSAGFSFLVLCFQGKWKAFSPPFSPFGVTGGEGRVHPWLGNLIVAYVGICGFDALLKGTSAVTWRCPGTFPTTRTSSMFCLHCGLSQEPYFSQPSSPTGWTWSAAVFSTSASL